MSMNTSTTQSTEEYVPFIVDHYIDNPVALARMKAHLTQQQLAERLGVSQTYISKVEIQDKVTPEFVERAIKAIHCKP